MGVNNTRYDRITVYLKTNQRNFFNRLIADFEERKVSVPSRSDLMRAIIDEMTGDLDWKTRPLIEAIKDFRARELNNDGK